MAGFSGMVMAARGLPASDTALVCGAVLLLSAAGSAMLNSVLDFPLDCRMSRLTARIRALEKLGQTKTVLVAVTVIAVGILLSLLYLSPLVTLLTLMAAFGYLVPYTLHLKRSSPFGAIPGAIPGALPVLIGYGAVKPTIGSDGLILFLLVLLWQPPHFWTLALRYQKDYRAAGLPVLPAALGEPYTKTFILLYATSLLPLSLSLWFFGYCSRGFAVLALLSGGIFLATLIRALFFTRQFIQAFHATNGYLSLILLLIVADICLQ
jgi:protoheme IX farnesyltransferase